MSAFSPDTAPKKKPFSLQLDPSLFEPASAAEKEQHDVMRESTTFFRDGMRRLVRNPLAMLSIAVLLILLVTILIAPMIVPYGYSEVIRVGGQRDRTTNNMRPFQYSEKEQEVIDAGGKVFPHIFGTDELGRDYFIRVVFGAACIGRRGRPYHSQTYSAQLHVCDHYCYCLADPQRHFCGKLFEFHRPGRSGADAQPGIPG